SEATTTTSTSPNIMKFSGGDSEILCGGGPVDTLLLTTCWSGAGSGGGTGTEHFLIDGPAHKLVMDSCSTTDEDSATKATMDALDSLLLTSSSQNSPPGSNTNFAELKPLPPFTGYTGHLSINGIPGHHFHAIAAPPQSPQSPHNAVSSIVETNNNTQTTNHNTNSNVVFKSGNNGGATLYYTVSTSADQSVVSSSTVDGVSGGMKPEFVDYSLLPPEIEDIAAIIGSAIADTTVPNVDGLVGPGEDAAASRDSWMDLDAWIDTAFQCIWRRHSNYIVDVAVSTDTRSAAEQQQSSQHQQQSFNQQAAILLKRESSTSSNFQQSNHMSLLESRLQNGPPSLSNGAMKPEPSSYLSECQSPSSSTSYLNSKDMMLPHTTTGSPPGHVVSTTDNTILLNGARYQSVQRSRPGYRHISGLKTGIPSPDLLVNGSSLDSLVSGSGLVHGNYPHTTAATTTTPSPSKSKNRSRSSRKQHSGGGGGGCGGGAGSVYATDGSGGIMGKEKPVHRCTICNRGFLNKSNIKVHLRTHTGEKPFRCEVCGKAFRQKAHLIKHQQIHKRVGRD
ncbi:hypothetical protein L9F63_027259, partial [Diploptera punctata]